MSPSSNHVVGRIFSEQDLDLIARYVREQLDQHAAERFEERMLADPELAEAVLLESELVALGPKAFAKLDNADSSSSDPPLKQPDLLPQVRRSRAVPLWAIAASVLLAALPSLWLLRENVALRSQLAALEAPHGAVQVVLFDSIRGTPEAITFKRDREARTLIFAIPVEHDAEHTVSIQAPGEHPIEIAPIRPDREGRLMLEIPSNQIPLKEFTLEVREKSKSRHFRAMQL
jgi:hypothetical protein